ncbi:GNAT family N-acetyltransferase [Pedobacter cryophilus]|uniref:GNAT family N-acetyltransferase n=2 Tax=Pedobacter cryophilus TaxID=2571271 RepID=A0A4U1C202_9SPHI|nr:GNAT family N-acetyltransferase [Pedobacter cryophilus]
MTYAPIVVTAQEEWSKYIDQSFDHDVYHTYEYHALDKRGTPVLFVFQNENNFIAFPLLKRQIENSFLFDLTSIYGYCGPISNKKIEDIDAQTKEDFETCFNDFLADEKCISVFARLHPFFNQTKLLNNLGDIKANGKTIYMDLTISLEAQRENYNKRLARQIRQLRKRNYLVKEAANQQEIRLFTEMYADNMNRLSASESYYFSEDYFSEMLKNSALNCKLILVYDGDVAICGALIICSKNIIRNHLSATNANYIKESPSKLLTDEISIIGREMGAKYFHLGGGLRGQNDSLFIFKSYFSNLFLEDHIWCYIVDDERYQAIVNEKNINVDDGFFPLYRSVQANKSSNMALT